MVPSSPQTSPEITTDGSEKFPLIALNKSTISTVDRVRWYNLPSCPLQSLTHIWVSLSLSPVSHLALFDPADDDPPQAEEQEDAQTES